MSDVRAKARAKVAAQSATVSPSKVDQKNFSCLYCQGTVDSSRNFIHEKHCALARKRDKKAAAQASSTADDESEGVEEERQLQEFAQKLEIISK